MVQFINWWDRGNNIQDNWFEEFFKLCCSTFNDGNHEKIHLYSVFGPMQAICKNKDTNCVKIFFTGENTKHMHTHYGDETFISSYVDIVCSFFTTTNKSIRFPLWCMYWNFYKDGLFTPISHERNNRAILVANHTANGLRTQILSYVQQLGIEVDANRKDAFPTANQHISIGEGSVAKCNTISNYSYNICCENSYAEGYVTEKCFEALSAGCIPIYMGNCPLEPSVLHQTNIVYVNDQAHMQKLKTKRFDEEKMWKEDALVHIFGTYLKLWSKVVKCMGWKDRAQIKSVAYNATSKEDCVKLLATHWKTYSHFLFPRAVFKVQDEVYYMEDLEEICNVFHL
jgi:hypothetical protein